MSGKPDAWKAYWQDDACRLIHFIGKDNIVFHCLIFPWMLKSHGGYVLPDNVPANEFLNIEGKKISTSRGWAIWLSDYLEDFPPDYLRYGLSTILPETKDADFSWKDFQARVNNELADTLGNFVNRTVTFCDRYFDGLVPALDGPNEKDTEALAALAGFPAKVAAHIEAFRFRDGVACAMSLGRLGNKYFNDAEPWATRKKDMRACGNTIHVSLQLCAALSILFEPVLPFSCAKIRDMLRLEGLRSSGPDVAAGGEGELGWEDAARPLLEAGHKLGTPEILFTKILDKQVEEQILKLNAGKLESVAGCTSGAAYAPLKDYIEFDDFAKLDLRIGTVLEAEKVKKSKRLLRTLVDLGFEQRQILAGVAEFIAPEDLIGKKVVVVANLEPRKMMGLESQGMLLMAEDREGKLVPIVGESEAGAVLR